VDPLVVLRVEYGTLPDWLAGAGTVGALAVALVLLSQDLRARREVEEERRRAQASRVVCWLESVEDTADFTPTYGAIVTLTPSDHLDVVLHNGSEEPVFDCQVHVDLDPSAPTRATAPSWGWRLTLTERMIPPGRTRRPVWELPGDDLPHTSAWMVFTDTNNQRWQREHSGRLSRVVDRRERPSRPRRVGPGAYWHG
jgi:hypothetical protein